MSRILDQRGAGSALVAMTMVCLVCAALVAMWIVGWLGSAHRAANAADLAALAGAQAYVEGSDACAAAQRSASTNGGRVERCGVEGTSYSFVVRVSVSAPLTPAMPHGPRRIEREAAAGTLE